jgi:hypothetical protein
MKRAIWLPLFALVAALTACGGETETVGGIPDRDAAVGGGEMRIVEGLTTQEVERVEPSGRKEEDGPKIMEVHLHPDPPLATGPFRVEPVVDNPAPGPLNLTYEWYVNGHEVLGIWNDTLGMDEFSRGDRIQVSILARDYNGKVDTFRLANVEVGNSTPQIVRGVGPSGQLDGATFQATDPDGDPVRWSIENAPPGLTIHPTSGKLHVDSAGVYDQGEYAIEVVATDPAGGEGRMGFSVNLGGAVAGRTETREVADAEVIDTAGFSDEELEKRTNELFERMENMSAEELEAYLEKTALDPDEAAAAAELPVGAPAPPL